MRKVTDKAVDPDDAPEGYIAVASEGECVCWGCAFEDVSIGDCWEYNCLVRERKDECDVVFKKQKEPE